MSELGIAGDPSGSQTLWVQVSDTTPFNAFTASSSQPAFEFDLPGPAVPEPPTWAILLTGFACLRFAYRRCRRAQVQVIG